jgi:hypothetical protein
MKIDNKDISMNMKKWIDNIILLKSEDQTINQKEQKEFKFWIIQCNKVMNGNDHLELYNAINHFMAQVGGL